MGGILRKSRRTNLMFSLVFTLFCFLLFASKAWAGDPSGEQTFALDFRGVNMSANFTWILLTGFTILFMQVGFVFLGGFLQSKNVLSYMTHCFLATSLGALIYLVVGFAFMFGGFEFLGKHLGGGNSFIGWSGFFLFGEAYDVRTITLFLFQAVVATFIGSIIAGAVAERMKLSAYVLSFFFIYTVIYPIYGHWVWGEGWLFNLPFGVGVRDFAGSGVVHAVGGSLAFVGACFLGPRIGKYSKDGTPGFIPGHNVGYMVIGTILLAFGWLGYDAGSTLAAGDLRASVVAANTFVAGAMGAVTVLFYTYLKTGASDIGEACNGFLAGLVAISASCAYVAPWAAVSIGFLGGITYVTSVWFVEHKLKVDDPLGAVSVHGANGLWGLLSVGIFADGTYGDVSGLITGNGGQLLSQFIACVTAIAWAGGLGCVMYLVLKSVVGIRVSERVEFEGLDVNLHGSPCYRFRTGVESPLSEEEERDKNETALLDAAFAKDAQRERIYSEKLGIWITAKPKTEEKK
ncbi:MAG: ammonium transporter [Candidatus Scalindua sp. AMX11]|nr:MAG: ammonium transporter [Candidatus Scalindua sp.]NOG83281.1 ammonium transporter [Planctomycetota bacterium]RZV71957.1 MAG: ammonium transporter [Candidatus Scalindua sp. SCAELEC01]TDE63605.1 MAG: ammonium transporter [Candidatus Scalindua sp. AMX11]GJQ60051.1 MAG: ammonium transporter [Candidatus Scalindua sp.]